MYQKDDHRAGTGRGIKECVTSLITEALFADLRVELRADFAEEASIHIYSLEPGPIEVRVTK